MTDTAQLIVALGLKDNLSAGLGRASAQLKGLETSAGRLGRGIGQVGQGLDRIITRGAIAAAAGLGAVLKVTGDFEAQLNTIGTIAVTSGQTTQAGLKGIGDGIRALSRETGADLSDLTKGYYDLLSAGIKVADAQDILKVANQLAVGAIGTNSEAVDVLTTALNSYNLTGADAVRVSDQLAEAVAAGKTTLSEIAPTYAQVAPLAAQFGIGTDEVAAALGRLTSLGNDSASTVTQMSRAILELVKPKGPLKDLQDSLGVNFADEVRKNGLVATLQEIRDAADKAGIPFQDLFSRIEGFRFAVQVTGDSNAAFVEELDRVRKAAGLTADQFSERQQGLNYQIDVLRANLKSAGIDIGTELLPVFTDLAKQLADFLQKPETQASLKQFAQDLAGGIKSVIAELKGADFSGLIGGMKVAAEVAKSAFDLFNKLPPDIKALAIGALAVNKVTGGGVGLLAKGLGNLVLGGAGLLSRGSSPANALWVQSVGGFGGGVGDAAGLAGVRKFLPTGLTGWLGFLGIAAADFALIATAVSVFQDQAKNVQVAADFERRVVERRSAGGINQGVSVTEDLRTQLAAGGGDPLASLLKTVFVNPELKRQIVAINLATLTQAGLTPAQIQALLHPKIGRGGESISREDLDSAVARLAELGIKVTWDQATRTFVLSNISDPLKAPPNPTDARDPAIDRLRGPNAIAKGAVDPAIERLIRERTKLPDTAFSPSETRQFAELPHITEKLRESQTALREQGSTLRRILAKPNPPTHFTIPVNVNVNASLIASRIYQISTSARLREG